MRLKRILLRMEAFLQFAGLLISRDAEMTVHLCQLLISAHLSSIPTITLRTLLSQLQNSSGYQPNKVIMHPFLRGDGSGSASEMAALSALVAAKQPMSILEFGTYDGFSTWHLWANSSSNTKIVTIDLPSGMRVAGSSDFEFQGVYSRPFLPEDSRVELVEIESRLWNPHKSTRFDFCFIDAGHTHECVKNDTEKALALMNEGGIVVWHDATWRKNNYGVNKYLKEMRHSGFDMRLLTIGPFDYSGLAVLICDGIPSDE